MPATAGWRGDLEVSTLLFLAVVFVPMLAEARRARANEAYQRACGGVEPDGDVYAVMRVAYPAAFLAMIGEGAVRGGPPPLAAAIGGGLFVAAKALKWWAVRSLGRAWTFRVIVVPGRALVASGPYAHVRHPNYIAVVGELVGVGLMAGAMVSGPAATAAFLLLIARRIRIEDSALNAILRRH
jgi:methyltransferase